LAVDEATQLRVIQCDRAMATASASVRVTWQLRFDFYPCFGGAWLRAPPPSLDPPLLTGSGLGSGRTKKKPVGGTTASRQKLWDFDAMYYMEVHNCSGGIPRTPGNSSTAHGWGVQKWLNWSRCHFGSDWCWFKEPSIRCETFWPTVPTHAVRYCSVLSWHLDDVIAATRTSAVAYVVQPLHLVCAASGWQQGDAACCQITLDSCLTFNVDVAFLTFYRLFVQLCVEYMA